MSLVSLQKDIIVGLLAAYVPINAMGTYLNNNNCTKNGFSIVSTTRYTPLFFALLFPVVMSIIRRFGLHTNLYIVGFIFGIVISSIGRFIFKIPTRLFEMENPFMFHVYAIVVWTMFFLFMGRMVYSL